MAKEPAAVEALKKELDDCKGHDRRLDRAIDRAFADFEMGDAEYRARSLIEGLALATAGALMSRYASPEVYEGFAVSRLGGDHGGLYGTLPAGVNVQNIIEPAIPI